MLKNYWGNGLAQVGCVRVLAICEPRFFLEEKLMSTETGHRMLSSRSEFHDALRDALELAATQGCRELIISDATFADWPLGERGVVDALTRWAYAHRRLTVLAHNYDDVPRRHPRWVAWRRQWDHVISCRALPEAQPEQIPGLLIATGLVTVRVFDAVHYRASVSTDHADEVRARELIDALLQQSNEAFPASALGL
jgi:hypothetical protein